MSYHVICGACRKSHSGQQIWNSDLEDYVCINCVHTLSLEKSIVESVSSNIITYGEVVPMEVNINIEDVDGNGAVIVKNSPNKGNVFIAIDNSKGKVTLEIQIDEIRTALRKISAN